MPEEPLENDQQTQFNPQPSEPANEGPELVRPTAPETMFQQPTQTINVEPQIPSVPVMEPVLTQFKPTDVASETPTIMSEPVMQAPPSEPIANGMMSAPVEKPSWIKKNKLLVIVASATLAVLILAGSAFAVTSWYQNPKKVLADAVVNMVTAKTSMYTGKITLNMDDSSNPKLSLDVSVDAKQADATGSVDVGLKLVYSDKTYALKSSGLYDTKGDLYIKVQDLKDLVTELKSTFGSSISPAMSNAIEKFVSKIDGVWIRISSDDLKTYSDSAASSQKCLNNAIDEFKKNQSATKEVTNLYEKNSFIAIDKDLGEKNGSIGYQLSLNYDVMKSFATGFKDTKIYKDMHNCDSSFEINPSDIKAPEKDPNPTSDTVNTIWISTWGHKITKYETRVTGTGSYSKNLVLFTVEPKFNEKVTVATPKDYITLTDLKTYVDDLSTSISESYML